jgi:hypothetical protein
METTKELFNFIHVGIGECSILYTPAARICFSFNLRFSNGRCIRKWRAMYKGYANIAYSIGRGIQRRSLDDRLSDRLLDLLDRLRERDDLKNTCPPHNRTSPDRDKVQICS